MRRLLAALLALVALAAAAAPAAHAARGLRAISSQRIDDRLTDVVVATPALAAPVHVRILVPAGYASHPRARYPVLYLLHGALADWRSWTDEGDAERITAGLNAIVVMPEGGNGGWYTNWFNGGSGGPPEWETFHIGRLIPWVDATYRTVARRGGRAIAGLSMGGFGAMSYAARHPDLFVWAASFSGADPIEDHVRLMSVSLHHRLGALRIAHTWGDYGPGTHSWPYWHRDLERALPSLTSTFAHPRAAPSPFTFTAAERDYGAYGWRVRFRRARMAFSTLADAGPRGFRLRNAGGRARVTTAPLYRPRSAHSVAVGRAAPRTITADRRGRLRIDLRGDATVRIGARAGSLAA